MNRYGKRVEIKERVAQEIKDKRGSAQDKTLCSIMMLYIDWLGVESDIWVYCNDQ